MSEAFRAPRGTRDILPPETRAWQGFEALFRDICERFRYEEIRTPVFEETQLFARGIGDTTDIVTKEMYTFSDKSGRALALRPEGTASVVRAYAQAKLGGQNQLHKFFYIMPIFRYERPQAGRYRQSHQVGVEAIGSPGPDIDAEVIALNASLYRELRLPGASLHLNSIGCPACRPAYRDRLRAHFEPMLGELCPDCQRRHEANPLRIVDCKVPRCKELAADPPSVLDSLCEECVAHWDGLRRVLDALDEPYVVDPKLVRGLDYYTRTAFEFTSDALGAQDALSGGGRYDGLVELCGGKPTPGLGFAAGIERALLVLEQAGATPAAEQPPLVYVAGFGAGADLEALGLVHELRKQGICAETDFFGRGLRAQLRHADHLGAALAALIGEDELSQGVIALRDLADGSQRAIPRDQAAERIKACLGNRAGDADHVDGANPRPGHSN